MAEIYQLRDERLEQAALGAILTSERAAFKAFGDLGVTDDLFGGYRQKVVVRAARELYDAGAYTAGLLDMLVLEAHLRAKKQLGELGPDEYLVDLYSGIPSPAAIEAYIKALERYQDMRHVRDALDEAKASLRDGNVDRARATLSRVSAKPRARELLKSAALQCEDLVKQLIAETKPGGGVTGTGFAMLDSKIDGFIPGRLYVLAGLTSMGKTTLALQFALEVAKQGQRVHVWSKEMNDQDCRRRLASLLAGMPLPRGVLLNLTPKQEERLDGALKMLKELPIDIDDRATTLPQMVDFARARRGEIGLYIVDHSTIVKVPDARGEYEAVTAVSNACKHDIAVDCESACLLLSQFNRDAAKEKSGKAHQLRGSGAVEQDANVVMAVARDSYMSREKASSSEASITIWKNRDTGKCGMVPLEWDRRLARYVEVAAEYNGEENE